MYFYYKNKYENKSKDNEYLPKNFNLTNFKINNFLGIKIQERKIF